jgi:hypothetical protein
MTDRKKQLGARKSKYAGFIQKFIQEKIENPKLPINQFCKERNVKYIPFFRVLKRGPKIMESILKRIMKQYHERSIEVDEALFQKAQQGDPRSIELWYKRMES